MKIILLGDSLTSIKDDNKRPETGWGEYISSLTNMEVLNLAMNGRSTKSFINDINYPVYLNQVESGDLVLIQFGHNDQKNEDKLRYTNPNSDYQDNLIHLAEIAINAGAFPIILSSVSRLILDSNNQIDSTNLRAYHLGAKDASKKINVPFIPVYDETISLYKKIGTSNLNKLFLHLDKGEHINYPNGVIDNTHLNDIGAKIISSLIVNLLINNNILNITSINDKLLKEYLNLIK